MKDHMKENSVRLVGTKRLLELCADSYSARMYQLHPRFPDAFCVGGLVGLTDRMIDDIRGDADHFSWGVFPHPTAESPLTTLSLVDPASATDAADQLQIVSGHADEYHLRTVWNVSVVLYHRLRTDRENRVVQILREFIGGPVAEAVLCLPRATYQELPEYNRLPNEDEAGSHYGADGNGIRPGRVRVADTATLQRLHEVSVTADHLWVLNEETLGQLDPNGTHVCWGAHPHSSFTHPNLQFAPADNGGSSDDSGVVEVKNGGARRPHTRTVWLLAMKDGEQKEAILHMSSSDLAELPLYRWDF